MEKYASKILIIWMVFLIIMFSLLSSNSKSEQIAYYKFGPNNTFNVLGISINNYSKYFIILSICIINCIMRSIMHNILNPWVINSVQDITKKKNKNIHYFAYESSCVITLYVWLDWYISINILLSQVDIFIVEVLMDLLMIVILTRYYLTTTPKENIEIKLTDEENQLKDIENQLTDEEIKQTKQTKQIKQINQIDDNKHMYYEVNNLAQNSVIYNYLIIQ
jgi:hypothetical protein